MIRIKAAHYSVISVINGNWVAAWLNQKVATAAYPIGIYRAILKIIKWQSLNNCRHDCTQTYDFMYQFQWHAVQFIASLSNISFRNIFTQPTAHWEGRWYVARNGNCLHKYLYFCVHFQFCDRIISRRWINWLSDENVHVICLKASIFLIYKQGRVRSNLSPLFDCYSNLRLSAAASCSKITPVFNETIRLT